MSRRGALAALLLLTALAACGEPPPAPGTAGVAGRKAVGLAGLDRTQGGDGACFSGYRVSAGGLDSQGAQRYVLTFDLEGTPADQAHLLATLSGGACAAALASATATVVARLGLTSPGPLDVTYRLPSGARLIVP
ncbi:MAG TPA: hypothetical protein VG245_08125 [Candidatus Dormibacteraeota bacterium]|jgi:hypothetical protein|nr:hypothetical protein [Candidatus Dormibacteraeota bacterium]